MRGLSQDMTVLVVDINTPLAQPAHKREYLTGAIFSATGKHTGIH